MMYKTTGCLSARDGYGYKKDSIIFRRMNDDQKHDFCYKCAQAIHFDTSIPIIYCKENEEHK